MNIPYRGSRGPQHLLVDSTRIKVEGEGEWHARKHGGTKRRVWRKIHLGIDEQTLEVRAVAISGNHICDAPVLPDLLSQTPPEQEIGIVTAEGAYDTRQCHDAIADRGAHAVIPPRKTPDPESRPRPVRWHGRKHCGCQNIWGERSGETEVDTTAEAAPQGAGL